MMSGRLGQIPKEGWMGLRGVARVVGLFVAALLFPMAALAQLSTLPQAVYIGVGESIAATSTAVAPLAGGVIVSIPSTSLPAGTYQVQVGAGYGGVSDVVNNMRLQKGATTFSTLYVVGVVNIAPVVFVFPQVVLDGTQALSINAIAAGAAGSVYNGSIVATRIR